MKVCFWTTTLQADILSLAYQIEQSGRHESIIVTPDPDPFFSEPLAQAMPLHAPVLRRKAFGTNARVRRFRPDVIVADNHLPPRGLSERLAYFWHGLGWRVRGPDGLAQFHKKASILVGDVREPNPNFMAQCYGPADHKSRIEDWGIAPQNCRILGMAYSDLILNPPYSKENLAPFYSIDILNRPTVLLSLTWAFGRTLQRFGNDIETIDRLFSSVEARGGNVLFCLHDRFRYDKKYLVALHAVAARHEHVQIKHKDEHPDNLADLIVADVMISNYSSFINFFYPTERPSIHIFPVIETEDGYQMHQYRRGKVRPWNVSHNDPFWMIPPEDTGGLVVHDEPELMAALDRALAEPDCCQQTSRSWIDRYVEGMDKTTCARIEAALEALVAGEPPASAT
ncbi:MAG: hypothetical protein J7M25_18460 [Deltaproteobacteria bacterium]|nr:hypothetical protein [Deltaproteobacteria bacterium]